MTDSQEELRKQLSEMQAVHGIDTDTRNVIGILSETITTLGKEIDDLQQRVAELEKRVDETDGPKNDDEQQKHAWYSER
ncbi:hypothetical protein [Haladaptatus caseinilyticus]|uniref:hypothetical protein n=1 Tax=Haladaptatus caseinilyticus TaxID=2993314 RepID=UPI00224AFA06|nr:hypothetical protein [Haladaptatus caseinilyticus]